MRLSVTPGGVDLLLHCLEGGPSPVFTAIVLGNGSNAGSEATELSNPIHTFGITAIEREEESEYVTLHGEFNNADITERFRATETGILAQDPDDENATILFAYAYVPSDEAPVIPAAADYTFETTDHFIVYVGKTENVSAVISNSLQTVSRVEFDIHVNDLNNPHQVTKEQIGLDQVVNASPENTVVTYPAEENGELPVPGETNATFFQKVWTWLTALKTHLTATNPHKLTADDVDAARSSHEHSTTDIISGVLSLARGGTGVSSIGALLRMLNNYGMGIVTAVSYTGTGTYGAANPKTLAFSYPPKLLVIQPQYCESGREAGIVVINGVSTVTSGGVQDDVANANSLVHFTWVNNRVSWYNANSATWQCNVSGMKYIVLAIL